MGLDMYLRYENPEKCEYENIIYWRKMEGIRNWFINNLKDFEDNWETKINKEIFIKFLNAVELTIENPYREDNNLCDNIKDADIYVDILKNDYNKLIKYKNNSDEWFENLYYSESY